MDVVVARASRTGETRVALVPELVGDLSRLGYRVAVQPGAGERAGFTDAEYRAAGADIDEALERADVVLAVQPLEPEEIRRLRRGTAHISFLPVERSEALVDVLRDAGVSAFSMEQVPRISRAQGMDALTSQALVAGYRGVVVAAGLLRTLFPVTVTAAGTVPAAKVLVLGAGVAGLQAIATARRLGAAVSGYDVRAASAEEIRSLGAEFVDLGLPPLEGARGYAREMTAKRAERQRALLAPHVAATDALITTAAVPGHRAPLLVTSAMLGAMRPGSVVVDLAAESGGNVEGVQPGRLVKVGDVQVWGGQDVPGQLPGPASRLYARNVVNLVTLMTRAGELVLDLDDEIVAATLVTCDGRIIPARP